ncbi:succinylglutamate desuccinylase [Aminipila butyrica]|uniref:Succinylglutamate desuccinylase n=1 Tax=Aminipila butyrica TaxID=433296 RepID=A0A858BR58_9FIRM|nr:M14 family metallopeptidase [Aminipila butyrica]QIB68007.1 succinylglutamate desuccinylase [Aminipila butyrica]
MKRIRLKDELKNKNTKIQGLLTVGREDVLLPVTVICGKEEGKTVLVTGGIHNAEYVGIQAAITLAEALVPAEITGRIVILPLVNTTGFEHRTMSLVYEDGKNLNREFPGNPDGTLAQQICYFIEKEVFSEIDYYIDLHCGDGFEALAPYVYCQGKASEEVCRMSEQMARQVQVPYIVQSQSGTGGAYNYAGALGIPGILLERGNMACWSPEEVEADVQDVKRILRLLEVLPEAQEASETVKKNTSPKVLITEAIYQGAEKAGCWYPRFKPGQTAEKGEILGEIRDYFGQVLEVHRASETCVILYQIGSLTVQKQETVIAYGKICEEQLELLTKAQEEDR